MWIKNFLRESVNADTPFKVKKSNFLKEIFFLVAFTVQCVGKFVSLKKWRKGKIIVCFQFVVEFYSDQNGGLDGNWLHPAKKFDKIPIPKSWRKRGTTCLVYSLTIIYSKSGVDNLAYLGNLWYVQTPVHFQHRSLKIIYLCTLLL